MAKIHPLPPPSTGNRGGEGEASAPGTGGKGRGGGGGGLIPPPCSGWGGARWRDHEGRQRRAETLAAAASIMILQVILDSTKGISLYLYK